MIPPLSEQRDSWPRWYVVTEWAVVVGLAAALAWTTLCLGGYLAETMVVTAWLMAGLAVLGGVLLVSGGRSLQWVALLPLPFLAYALISGFVLAPARWLAWREWLLWLQIWVVFVLTLHAVRSRAHVWAIVGTVIALALSGVGLAAYQRYVDPAWMMLGRMQAPQFLGRSAGMFGIPNSLAGLLELVLPVCLTLLFARSTTATGKVVCAWLAALFVSALVLTGSRGGWIGVAGALMLWPLLAGREWKRKVGGVALVGAIAVAGIFLIYRFSEPARERILPFIEGKFEASRPVIWKVGLRIWQDHPWFGSGAASYNVVFDQYRPAGFLNEPDWAHNDYLNTLSDYGVVGFALWFGAGAVLLACGWRQVRRARQSAVSRDDIFTTDKWKLGLFLGLIAYALHLGVDFHTKIPALGFAGAMGLALLLRDRDNNAVCSSRRIVLSRAVGGMLAIVPVAVIAWVGGPLYRAEALRFPVRRDIDRFAASGQGDAKELIPHALAQFTQATEVDPGNGQAWADLSYALVQSWHVERNTDLRELGARAEAAASRALERCEINAEYWVRRGVALDMQARQADAEMCFKRAVELAPNSPAWHYYYAYHLSVRPGRRAEAVHTLETCLALDPSFSAGVALHQQLTTRR